MQVPSIVIYEDKILHYNAHESNHRSSHVEKCPEYNPVATFFEYAQTNLTQNSYIEFLHSQKQEKHFINNSLQTLYIV